MKEALEKADLAEHQQDLASRKETEVQKQLEILSQKLTEQRTDITNQLQTQWKAKFDEVLETSKLLENENARLKAEVLRSFMPLVLQGYFCSEGDVQGHEDSAILT